MKIRAIAALLFILISVSAFGEGRIKITGYVRDADGNPLELVNDQREGILFLFHIAGGFYLHYLLLSGI